MDYVRPYFTLLQETIDRIAVEPVEETIRVLHEARVNGRKIFIMGNGGSASTASHFVCDLAKNTRCSGWADYRVIGLTDNMALMTAYANDEGYENVFAQQLASLVEPDDVVVGISTSGNSPNVLRAMEVAQKHRTKTIAFTGFDAGKLGQMADIHVHVPSDCIEHVEDIHLVLEHLVTKALRELTQER
jgi:D-sedoheptulose 7-phosphate isomerase